MVESTSSPSPSRVRSPSRFALVTHDIDGIQHRLKSPTRLDTSQQHSLLPIKEAADDDQINTSSTTTTTNNNNNSNNIDAPSSLSTMSSMLRDLAVDISSRLMPLSSSRSRGLLAEPVASESSISMSMSIPAQTATPSWFPTSRHIQAYATLNRLVDADIDGLATIAPILAISPTKTTPRQLMSTPHTPLTAITENEDRPTIETKPEYYHPHVDLDMDMNIDTDMDRDIDMDMDISQESHFRPAIHTGCTSPLACQQAQRMSIHLTSPLTLALSASSTSSPNNSPPPSPYQMAHRGSLVFV